MVDDAVLEAVAKAWRFESSHPHHSLADKKTKHRIYVNALIGELANKAGNKPNISMAP